MSTMSESGEGVPWLDDEDAHAGGVATATVIEGAELVRTAAVSYATPILHQVFIQGAASTHPHGNGAEIGVVTVSPSNCSDVRNSSLMLGVDQPTAVVAARSHQNGFLGKGHCETGGGALFQNENISTAAPLTTTLPRSTTSLPPGSSPASSTGPLWVLPPLLPSSSVVLRPVTQLISSSSSSSSSSPSPPSASSPPILSLPFRSVGGGKNDDELTSLSWLQDSNLLMGTALSPIKQQPSSHVIQEATPTTIPVAPPSSGERKRSHRAATRAGRKEATSVAISKPDEGRKEFPTKKAVENAKADSEEEFKAESPTSDYAEETSDVFGDGHEDGKASGPAKAAPQLQPIPYNPKIHIKAKPPFSFSCLIFMAIEESPTKALPVKDIYSWILQHYPYYRNAPTGWKNSVRHNLSLNKCFSKVEKAPNLGKGSLWMVDPTFRPNLLQAMSKIPPTPQVGSDLDSKSCMVSNKAIINTKYLYGLTSRTPEKVISMADFVVQNEVEVRPSSTATAAAPPCQQILHHLEARELNDAPKGSSQVLHAKNQVLQYLQPNPDPETTTSTTSFNRTSSEASATIEVEKRGVGGELRRKTKNKYHHPSNFTTTLSSTPSSSTTNTNTTTLYTPNPELFPRLAKRLVLESSTLKEEEKQENLHHQHLGPSTIGVQSEDVDAAAAMLVLKHGPRVLSPYHVAESFPNLQASPDLTQGIVVNSFNKRDHSSSESSTDSGLMVISSSPSLDHAYVGRASRKGSISTVRYSESLTPAMIPGQTVARTKDAASTSPASSVDEAFFDDSFETETVGDNAVTSLEPRPFEEADALLNLAAVATSLASRQMLVIEEEDRDPAFCYTESQPSPMETQVKTQPRVNDNSNKLPPRRLSRRSSNNNKVNRKPETAGTKQQSQQKEFYGEGVNQKTSKRKATFATVSKQPPSKKPANFTSVFPPKSNSAPIKASHNNNSNAVLNRNKLLKVKKELRAHKAKY